MGEPKFANVGTQPSVQNLITSGPQATRVEILPIRNATGAEVTIPKGTILMKSGNYAVPAAVTDITAEVVGTGVTAPGTITIIKSLAHGHIIPASFSVGGLIGAAAKTGQSDRFGRIAGDLDGYLAPTAGFVALEAAAIDEAADVAAEYSYVGEILGVLEEDKTIAATTNSTARVIVMGSINRNMVQVGADALDDLTDATALAFFEAELVRLGVYLDDVQE